jgi:hypothetical protein
VPTNGPTLTAFRFHVTNLWRRMLRRRTQKDWTTRERTARLANDWLPKPRILHPWPDARFAVRHPRWGARGNSRAYRNPRPKADRCINEIEREFLPSEAGSSGLKASRQFDLLPRRRGDYLPANDESFSSSGNRCFHNLASLVVAWPRVSVDAGIK